MEGKITFRVWGYILVFLISVTGLSCRKTNERSKEVTTASGVVMVILPGGWFEMGSESGNADEQPIHKVFLRPFRIDKYEVTNKQYAKFLRATGFPEPGYWDDPKYFNGCCF